MQLLSKDPAERPPSAAAVIEAIEAIDQNRALSAAPKRRFRRPLAWAGAAAVLACVLCLAGYFGWPPHIRGDISTTSRA